MSGSFRRRPARYPCDVPVQVFSFAGETPIGEGRFTDLSVDGAKFDLRRPLEWKTPYLFRLTWKRTTLELPGRVAWESPRDPKRPQWRQYGIQFNTSSQQEQPLRALVDDLRRA
jgi:hypothetical protein